MTNVIFRGRYTCENCGKQARRAADETAPADDELAVDTRGLVAANWLVCGECLDAAEERRLRAERPATG